MKILAVDISHIFRVNWEAAEGKQMGEAFRRTLDAVAKAREGFDRVAICCDAGKSFRTSIDHAYKAKREPAGPAYAEQLRRTIERCKADGANVFEAPAWGSPTSADPMFYYEADDVIGSLCSWTLGHDIRILSGDKDMLQLVCDAAPKIEVQKPDDGKLYDAAAVVEKLGIEPRYVADWLALAGDASDNYKPFPGPQDGGKRKPGIGDKTAVELIKCVVESFAWNEERSEHPALSIFHLLEHDDENQDSEPVVKCGPAIRAILKQHGRAAAERGLALATIRRDVPLDFSPLLAEPVVTQLVERDPTPPAAPQDLPPAQTSKALACVQSSDFEPLALQPRSMQQLQWIAQCAFDARIYGQFQSYEGIMMTILEARERGIPMGAALRNAYVVKGKLAWSTAMFAGLVLTSKFCERFEIIETTTTQATVAYKRKGKGCKAGTFTFTLDEAKHAGWLRSGEKGDSKWITNPRTMLRWAALRECARFVWPDIVAGMYTPDELRNGEITDAEFEHAAGAAL